jgi:hypothetical protein
MISVSGKLHLFGIICGSTGSSDIVNNLRSQTSWIWLETKLVELGMFSDERNYKVRILAYLSHSQDYRAHRLVSTHRYLSV